VVEIDGLTNEIARYLQQYTREVEDEIKVSQKEVSREAVKVLKKTGGFEDLSGDYRKGWKAKKVGNSYVIHNATDYQLTHLLEKGHVIKNGTGRSYGRTRAFEHIAPVEKRVIDEYIKRVEKAIAR
jgi:hypothetical protein